MTVYEIFSIIAAYLILLLTVGGIIANHIKKTNKRFEDGRVEKAKMSSDIKNLQVEIEKKANKELIEEQLKNIHSDLKEIKEALKS